MCPSRWITATRGVEITATRGVASLAAATALASEEAHEEDMEETEAEMEETEAEMEETAAGRALTSVPASSDVAGRAGGSGC